MHALTAGREFRLLLGGPLMFQNFGEDRSVSGYKPDFCASCNAARNTARM